jgi:hypothetical protein
MKPPTYYYKTGLKKRIREIAETQVQATARIRCCEGRAGV